MTTGSRWCPFLAYPFLACLFIDCVRVSSDATHAAEPIVIKWGDKIGQCLTKPPSFYASEEAARHAEMVLLRQRTSGGWPKNYNRDLTLTPDIRRQLEADKQRPDATFDNSATHSEVRFLARVHQATGDVRYRDAILRGIEFTLAAQYANGGWPQFNLSTVGDARRISNHITFNDDAMIGVMTALDEIARDGSDGDEITGNGALYPFVDAKLRSRCAAAVARGIECILQCQIEVAGQKTAWCAQYDEQTLAPRKARTYELASLSGSESVGITKFLMRLERPSHEVIEAVQGAVAWFNDAQLTGIRQIRQTAPGTPKGWNRIVVQDAEAPPMWARFYTIDGNRPIFCSRDGVPRNSLADISYERRNGYSWLGYYATDLLEKDYPAWQKQWAPADNVLEEEKN